MNARPSTLAVRALAWLFSLLPWVAAGQDSQLTIQFFNVGQADASLLTCSHGTHRVLIDSGDKTYPGSQENFRRELARALGGVTVIDIAVASHPHADHIGGMEWVLSTYRVGTYIDNGRPSETTTWSRLETLRRKLVKAGRLKYINGTAASLAPLKLCSEVTLTLITPAAHAKLSHTNDCSVGNRVDCRGKSFLFVGDMESHAEEAWLDRLSPQARALADVDVLKVGHHGSDTSTTSAFIQAVSPDLAFVMCGAKGVGTNSRYKHPRASTMRKFADWFKHRPPPVSADSEQIWVYNATTRKWESIERPAGIWLSHVDGTVTLSTDGKKFAVATSN